MDEDTDCGFTGSPNERNANIHTDSTNTPQTFQDKEQKEDILFKTDISVQSVQMNKGSIASPVPIRKMLPQMPNEDQLSLASLSYFADPTVHSENEESAEMSCINSDKYFSTPMPSKERARKKLTPVMEMDFEPNMSEEWQQEDRISTTDMHKNTFCADVLCVSPTKTPLYRSFFAEECQEIAHKIENIKTGVRLSPGKRKLEELDVSTIDAEPPPYDTTPMKSMLACEVAKMFCSLESGPIKEGLSLFEESLLDLENTHLNVSGCGNEDDKRHTVDDPEQLSLLSDAYRVQPKRQKPEPLEENDWEINVSQVNKRFPLRNVENLMSETPKMKSLHIYAGSKCDEEKTTVLSKNVLPAEQKLSDNTVEAAPLIQDMAVALSSPVRTESVAPVHEGNSILYIKHSSQSGEKKCVNTTQDVLNYDELPPFNTTYMLEVSNTKHSITSVHEEMTATNTTHEVELVPHAINATQDIPFIQEEVNIANATQVIEIVGVPFGSTAQDFACVVLADSTLEILPELASSRTEVMDVVPLSANTTQDITSIPETVNTANTTQMIEVGSHIPMNTTQDILSMHESKMANTTCKIEMELQSCVNATQSIVSKHDPILTANTMQVIESVPEASDNRALDTTSTPDGLIPTSFSQDIEVMQKSMDVPPTEEAIHSLCTDGVPEPICIAGNSQNEMIANHDNSLKDLTQPSLNMAQTLHSYVTPVNPSTLVSPSSQAKLNVTEGQNMEGQKYDYCTGITSSQKEVDMCKESRHQPLLSESCSMIQEEDDAHDVSVFSVSSLTFVTSTPVPGLNNFQFQNNCRDTAQRDPNMSIGSVSDNSSSKVQGEQRMIPLQKPYGTKGLDCKDKGKEMSRGSLLPPNMQRSMIPPSETVQNEMPSTSGIPSARRSLALYQNTSQNQALSKITPRCGIPGRGMIRPPLARQSLPRTTLGNPKQAIEGTGGSGMTNKVIENKLKAPKTAAKAKSANTISQLPTAPSSIKPPSRMRAPVTTGRLSIGAPKMTANLHGIPRNDTVSAIRPQTSGLRTGPPRPGTSSIHPPPVQSQKVSLKAKSQVQGLPTKRTQRELPSLGSQKENVSKAENTSLRSNTKQPTLPLDCTTQSAAFQAVLAESKPERCQHLEMNKCCQLLKAYEEFEKHCEFAVYEHGRCQQPEMCKCCRLLKMYEDFTRLCGQVEMTDMAGT